MKWTDKNIDKLYRERSENISLAYDESHWDEFESMYLGANGAPNTSNLSDAQIDEMYSASTEDMSFYYSSQYWNEFNESYSTTDGFEAEDAGVLNDNGVDTIYKEGARRLYFAYKPFYWDEFLSIWRRNRRPDLLWFVTAYAFIVAIGLLFFIDKSVDIENEPFIAKQTKARFVQSQAADNSNEQIDDALNLQTQDGPATPMKLSSAIETVSGSIDREEANDLEMVAVKDKFTVPLKLERAEDQGSIRVESASDENVLLGFRALDVPSVGLEYKNPHVPFVPDELISDEDVVLAFRALDVPSAGLVYKNPYVPFELAYVNYFAQADVGLSESIVAPSDHVSTSASLGLGMEMNKGNFSLIAAVMGRVENHDDLTLTRSAKIYGFGSEVHQFSVDLKQLYVVEGRLGVGYNINRHRLELGIRPSFVFSSKVVIATQSHTMGQNSNIQTSTSHTREQYGYMNGVNRLRLKPTIGYTFKVTPRLSIGGTIGSEMRSSIDDEYFDKSTNRFPIDGEIYLRKTLRFKK